MIQKSESLLKMTRMRILTVCALRHFESTNDRRSHAHVLESRISLHPSHEDERTVPVCHCCVA